MSPRDGDKMAVAESYGTDSIKLLKGLEAVRKRPGMYIGNTDDITGLHHMVTELVDNAIDEAQAGYCDHVSVVVHADDSVTVEDNGRGIPVGPHPVHKRETLEIILTDLHSGGKFDDNAYKVSGGLHGVGLSVVNALAGSLLVEVKREGKVWQQQYARGVPLAPIREVGKSPKTGTKITFKADPEIFSVASYNFDALSQRLRELAFLNSGVTIDVVDERDEKGARRHTFRYDGGIRSFVEHLNKNKEPLHDAVITFSDVKDATGDAEADAKNERLDVALQWNNGYAEQIFCFTNTISNKDGGTHLEGLKTALTRAIQKYAEGEPAHEEPEGHDARRRRLPRGADGRRLPEDPGPEVLLADEGEARLAGGEDLGPDRHVRQALQLLRGEPEGREADHRQDRRGRARPRGGAQGARARPAEGGARRRRPARQARRLPGRRPGPLRALHRRGRLGRRLGQAGARPADAGDPAAQGEDPERREGALRQDARLRRDPLAHPGARRGDRRGVRPRQAPVPPHHPDDRRRRGRLAHPDAPPHLLLPADARGDRAGLPLHRPAAPLQGRGREEGDVPQGRQGVRALPARPDRRRPDAGGRAGGEECERRRAHDARDRDAGLAAADGAPRRARFPRGAGPDARPRAAHAAGGAGRPHAPRAGGAAPDGASSRASRSCRTRSTAASPSTSRRR